jgi:hypothetical protein
MLGFFWSLKSQRQKARTRTDLLEDHVGLCALFNRSMSPTRSNVVVPSSPGGDGGGLGLSAMGPSHSSVARLSSESRLILEGGGRRVELARSWLEISLSLSPSSEPDAVFGLGTVSHCGSKSS